MMYCEVGRRWINVAATTVRQDDLDGFRQWHFHGVSGATTKPGFILWPLGLQGKSELACITLRVSKQEIVCPPVYTKR
eukprot:2109443-Amphidinium_carterae.2